MLSLGLRLRQHLNVLNLLDLDIDHSLDIMVEKE